jgi:integrase
LASKGIIEHCKVRKESGTGKSTINHDVRYIRSVLIRQPKQSGRAFPFNSRSVTAGFQRVRNHLSIQDLRHHGLQHEGASRLFEAGYKIDEVAQVTGHKNINTLWLVFILWV